MSTGAEVSAIVASSGDHKTQAERLSGLLTDLLKNSQPNELLANLQALVQNVLSDENVSVVVARMLVADVVARVLSADAPHKPPNEAVKQLATFVLGLLQPRVISYEEQAAAIRQRLADIYESEREWRQAAQVLIGIPLEAGQRQYSADYKMRTYLRIAQLYLEAGDSVEAEAYVNRASLLQTDCKHAQLTILYKAQYARVLDSRRKFIEAAQRYYELSLKPELAESERETGLTNALQCTLLASAGQQRSRMLATLFKDDRCAALPAFGILHKMYLDKIIQRGELESFEASLQPHQRAVTADGWSILERAAIEHNLSAAAKLYDNVTFDQLGHLLGIQPHRAERVACQMLAEGRLWGSIDQLECTVRFRRPDPLAAWDGRVEALCRHVNALADAIAAAHPQWTAQVYDALAAGEHKPQPPAEAAH